MGTEPTTSGSLISLVTTKSTYADNGYKFAVYKRKLENLSKNLRDGESKNKRVWRVWDESAKKMHGWLMGAK